MIPRRIALLLDEMDLGGFGSTPIAPFITYRAPLGSIRRSAGGTIGRDVMGSVKREAFGSIGRESHGDIKRAGIGTIGRP